MTDLSYQVRVGDRYRVWCGDGLVHIVKRLTAWSGAWSCCAHGYNDAPIDYGWIHRTTDPVDCVGCLAEEA